MVSGSRSRSRRPGIHDDLCLNMRDHVSSNEEGDQGWWYTQMCDALFFIYKEVRDSYEARNLASLISQLKSFLESSKRRIIGISAFSTINTCFFGCHILSICYSVYQNVSKAFILSAFTDVSGYMTVT
jgi:hypothetical protein